MFAQRITENLQAIAFYEVVSSSNGALHSVPHLYSTIGARVHRAAAALAGARVRTGDRVLLCLEDSPTFLSFLLAAQCIGAVPVPLPCLSDFGGSNAFRERIHSVATDCEPKAIILGSNRGLECLTDLTDGMEVLSAEDADEADREPHPVPEFRWERSFDEVAFIQYTSGSTGRPKGVVVTHHNLVANMRSIGRAARYVSTDRMFNWLPLYHDMGLVGGFLIGMYLSFPTYVLPTRVFIGRPDVWLRSMSHFRATLTCAPNFAYHLLARRIPPNVVAGLDLSSWRLAFNGAEPVDRWTVEAFTERLAVAGLSATTMFPVYGMAECTLAITFPAPGTAPRYDFIDRDILAQEARAEQVPEGTASALCLVSVGKPIPGLAIRILQPDREIELPERHVGEIVVRGASVTPHYFQKDGNPPESRRELRTGDLGYVADGELYVVDRLKDLLVLAGRNIIPSDVERVVAQVPGIRNGSIVAFAVRGAEGTDELAIVSGVDPRARKEEIKVAIRAAIFEYFRLVPKDVVLVKPHAIPKTSSGKIRRRHCKELFEQGAFGRASSPPIPGR